MNTKYNKKMSLIVLAVMLLSTMMTPSSSAQGITLDGVLSETDWMLWFEDTNEPGFTVYHATDEDNVYLGIIVEDDDISDDHLQFALRADGVDYKIKIKYDTIICYRPGGEWIKGWWSRTVWGLPPGVEIVIGTTNGKTSYEICIAKSKLGDYTDDFPNNFVMWIMYISDNPGGPANYYPNVYAGWWWVVNQDSGDEKDEKVFQDSGDEKDEKVPEFHIPETPYGTILSLATMIGAVFLLNKRNKPLQP